MKPVAHELGLFKVLHNHTCPCGAMVIELEIWSGDLGFRPHFCWNVIFTGRKRSLWRLCFYTCLSVILFTGGSTWAGTPPRAGTPPGRYTPWQVHPPAGTPHGRYNPPWAGTHPRQCMLGYGQQAGGTHPTGMHSCFLFYPIHGIRR